MRLVEQAHEELKAFLNPGDIAIDATVGNGYDTTFLAQQVGPAGHVYGFDIQPLALEVATVVLKTRKCLPWCKLIQASHEEMLQHLPPELHGRVSAMMFNLGYLPHGDKTLVTKPESTFAALQASLKLLKPGGMISILSYRGHPGGLEEFERVHGWVQSNHDSIECQLEQDSEHPHSAGPYLWLLQRQ